jgi:hypothetical protein
MTDREAEARRRNFVGIGLRLPPELHTELKAIAEEEQRSLHGQILVLLRQGVARYRDQQQR